MQLGAPVTWDNPDIFLTELNGTPVPSSQLQPAHPYIVHGKISDAAFAAALGVEVRCYYQDWGFNGVRIPVETNPNGTERVVLLNIAPWSSAIAQFKWTTPAVSGHYCLKVECFHPDDKNPANNVGQENTDVLSGAPGQRLTTAARFVNPFATPITVQFTADTYRIPERKWEFRLETRVRRVGDALGKLIPENKVSRSQPTSFSRWLWGQSRGPQSVLYNYVGREEVLKAQRAVPAAIPQGWEVTVAGANLRERLALKPGESRDLELGFQIPASARFGEVLFFNVNALAIGRGPQGGVTVQIMVR